MPSYVVTGASRGIDVRASTLEFVKQLSANTENKVFAIVRNKAAATRLRDLSRDNVTILEADVTDANVLELATAEVSKATENTPDYLINDAVFSTKLDILQPLHTSPGPDALERDLLDNFKNNTVSVVHSTNAFLPLLKNGAAKNVLAVSSGVGDQGLTLAGELATKPSYSISTAALNVVVANHGWSARRVEDGVQGDPQAGAEL
ncbi:hypothetical protein B0H14DRAFT_3141433 [Mycena olivaceomarginata]|nr:hypothetical protein B0H14DRAFT_3141433 [Mycena olivaceomarginata]